jgi:hypothetical protein
MFSNEFSENFVLTYFIFANSVLTPTKSNENAKRTRVVPILATELKITADSEAAK